MRRIRKGTDRQRKKRERDGEMEESSGVLQCLKRSGFLRWATVSLVFNICSVATLMQLAEARWSYAAFTSSCLNAYPEIAQPSSIRPHHRTRPTSHLPSIANLVECSLYVTSALRHKCLTRWGTQHLPWHGRFTYSLHYLLFLLGLLHANTEAEIKSTPPMLFSTATCRAQGAGGAFRSPQSPRDSGWTGHHTPSKPGFAWAGRFWLFTAESFF